MPIVAGKLRHRIEIQTPVEVQDSISGAMDVTWDVMATVWASIEPMSAKEFVTSQTELSRVTTRITLRYRNDVNPSMRIYHPAKDKFYNIEGLLSDKQSGLEYMTLPCSEGVRYYGEDAS